VTAGVFIGGRGGAGESAAAPTVVVFEAAAVAAWRAVGVDPNDEVGVDISDPGMTTF
jgi:hypothetical protein